MTLYHSSNFKAKVLKPSVEIAGKITECDEAESNKFLYASSDREGAIAMAMASYLERIVNLDRFQFKDNVITLHAESYPRTPIINILHAIPIYLYTIETPEGEGWKKVNNKVNNSKTEWKTDKYVEEFAVEKIAISTWLKGKTLRKLDSDGKELFHKKF